MRKRSLYNNVPRQVHYYRRKERPGNPQNSRNLPHCNVVIQNSSEGYKYEKEMSKNTDKNISHLWKAAQGILTSFESVMLSQDEPQLSGLASSLLLLVYFQFLYIFPHLFCSFGTLLALHTESFPHLPFSLLCQLPVF